MGGMLSPNRTPGTVDCLGSTVPSHGLLPRLGRGGPSSVPKRGTWIPSRHLRTFESTSRSAEWHQPCFLQRSVGLQWTSRGTSREDFGGLTVKTDCPPEIVRIRIVFLKGVLQDGWSSTWDWGYRLMPVLRLASRSRTSLMSITVDMDRGSTSPVGIW